MSAAPPPLERATWREEGASLAAVTAALERLSSEQVHDGHGHATTRTLNLVVAPAARSADAAVEERLATLHAHHPSRTLVLREHGADRLDAEVTLDCATPAAGAGPGLCHDRATLTADPGRLAHADSLVRPLLVTGLPTVVWLPDEREGAAEAPLTDLGALVLVDSGAAGDPAGALARLRRLLERGRVHDLAWGRLDRWRARIAAAFDPSPRRALLPRVESVELRYGGPAADPLLLAGWLAARAGWRLEPLRRTTEGFSARTARPDGGALELSLVRHGDACGPGGVERVTVRAGSEAVDLERGAVVEHPGDELADALDPGEDYARGFGPALAAAGGALEAAPSS